MPSVRSSLPKAGTNRHVGRIKKLGENGFTSILHGVQGLVAGLAAACFISLQRDCDIMRPIVCMLLTFLGLTLSRLYQSSWPRRAFSKCRSFFQQSKEHYHDCPQQQSNEKNDSSATHGKQDLRHSKLRGGIAKSVSSKHNASTSRRQPLVEVAAPKTPTNKKAAKASRSSNLGGKVCPSGSSHRKHSEQSHEESAVTFATEQVHDKKCDLLPHKPPKEQDSVQTQSDIHLANAATGLSLLAASRCTSKASGVDEPDLSLVSTHASFREPCRFSTSNLLHAPHEQSPSNVSIRRSWSDSDLPGLKLALEQEAMSGWEPSAPSAWRRSRVAQGEHAGCQTSHCGASAPEESGDSRSASRMVDGAGFRTSHSGASSLEESEDPTSASRMLPPCSATPDCYPVTVACVPAPGRGIWVSEAQDLVAALQAAQAACAVEAQARAMREVVFPVIDRSVYLGEQYFD